MASRKGLAPQVMAYWLTSWSMAALAASFSSVGHGKSGKPWARLTASWARASLVISRMTDSVKVPTLPLTFIAALLVVVPLPGSEATTVPDWERAAADHLPMVKFAVSLSTWTW